MKAKKYIAIAALVLAGTHSAYSQTVIRITGSNGDRTATQTAISNLLTPGWTFKGTDGPATSANLSVATGTNFGAWNGSYQGTPVIIKVSFSGALAGIAAIAGNTDQRYVVTDGTGTGSVVNPLSSGAVLNTDYEIGKADFAFSTNFQSTSPFLGVFNSITYATVAEEVVGVSPLGFYASPGFPGSPSNPRAGYTPNITTQQAQLLYTSGSVRLSQLTGDYTQDTDKTVWAIGRNTDAGQRFGALTEIGLGTSTPQRVWTPTYSTAQTIGSGPTNGFVYGGVVGSHALWPAETISGIFSGLGSGGYASGRLLAEALTASLGPNAYKGAFFNEDTQETEFTYSNATAGYYVGYITPGDANNRLLGVNGILPTANRGVALSYNGVPLTTTNVKNGTYTAWLYNRILKPTDGRLNGFKLTFADALKTRIATVDAPSGGGFIDDATNRVRRFTDGGLVVPK